MKKINIGIVLIILAIAAFIGYMKIDSKNKQREFEKAKKFIDNYIQVATKYTVLPEEYRDLDKEIGEEKYKEYILKMKNELSNYILESQRDFILDNYESILEAQYKSKFIYKEYEVDTEYPGYYEIEDNVILVTLTEKTKISADKRISPSMNNETGKYIGKIKHVEQIWMHPVGMMIKKNEDGEYKVIFHMKYQYLSS